MSPRIVRALRAWSPARVQKSSSDAPEGVQKSNAPYRGAGLDSWTESNRCPYCLRSYERSRSCVYLKGDPVPDTFHAPPPIRCPGCNVAGGEIHHAYCDKATCPRCDGPFSDCGGTDCGVAA